MAYQNSIGVIWPIESFFKEDSDRAIDQFAEAGIETIQLQVFGDLELATEENAEKVMKKLDGRMRVTSVWGGWSGPMVWDFVDGPGTLGLVPAAYRGIRLRELKKNADFAKILGVTDMATHVGFIPEQPCYEGYRDLVAAVREIARYCKERGLHFNFETGQETPVTLMRVFQDVGEDNLGVNFDPANLILYGRGNPVDAVSIYGNRIRGVHVKDGDYPTDFHFLGKERVVGEGTVDFPRFLPKLLQSGYQGDLYIEREISGDQQIRDIIKTVEYIRQFM